MARAYPKLRGDDGKPFEIVIDKFNKGVMTLFDETRIPKEGVFQAQNMILDQDGVWTVRPGTSDYGATLTTPIDGAGSFTVYNSDGTFDSYIWVIDNGSLKVSQDGGAWSTKTLNGGGAHTWTTGKPAYGKQIGSKLYIGNGYDNMAYYDITNDYIVAFSALSAPTGLASAKTGMTGSSYTMYYKVTAVNAIGESVASSEDSEATGKSRDNWTIGTDYITLTWNSVSGAERYNIYYSDSTGTEVFLDSSSTTTYIDTGVAYPNPAAEAPDTDTSAGPKYAFLSLSGNRLWGTRDDSMPYRVGWTGVGQYLGAFNPFYGGGYVDLNKGGMERPEAVVHFRDGRGNAVATVLTSSPSGAGSTWHISLSTVQVDTLQVVVPQAYQQQGSVGTRSPRGVVEYNDSVYYPSPKGYQSVGSRQSILNVLVTTELSDAIRPSVRAIDNSKAHLAAGISYDGRIYWSVCTSGTTNNEIHVYDVERGGVWALSWSVGVKQFFEYTDTSGIIRLMGIPTSGTKLIQFGSNIAGDSGAAFSTNLLSGLIHWDDNHMKWAYVEKVYAEIADPVGDLNFSVSGAQKNKSFASLGSISITDSYSSNGFGADLFGDFEFGDTEVTDASFNQQSVKKYIRINKLLNNLQWQFSSTDINSQYTPMQVVIKGTILPTSDPSSYRAS
jgi:hypothetical protein